MEGIVSRDRVRRRGPFFLLDKRERLACVTLCLEDFDGVEGGAFRKNKEQNRQQQNECARGDYGAFVFSQTKLRRRQQTIVAADHGEKIMAETQLRGKRRAVGTLRARTKSRRSGLATTHSSSGT